MDWIDVATPPSCNGNYIVHFDRTVLWKDIPEEDIPDDAQSWAVTTCLYYAHDGSLERRIDEKGRELRNLDIAESMKWQKDKR